MLPLVVYTIQFLPTKKSTLENQLEELQKTVETLKSENEFYENETYHYDKKINKWKTKFDPENYKTKNFSEEVIDAKNQKVVVKLGEKINFLTAKKLATNGLKEIYVSNESLYGKFLHKNVTAGEDIFKIGSEILLVAIGSPGPLERKIPLGFNSNMSFRPLLAGKTITSQPIW